MKLMKIKALIANNAPDIVILSVIGAIVAFLIYESSLALARQVL